MTHSWWVNENVWDNRSAGNIDRPGVKYSTLKRIDDPSAIAFNVAFVLKFVPFLSNEVGLYLSWFETSGTCCLCSSGLKWRSASKPRSSPLGSIRLYRIECISALKWNLKAKIKPEVTYL